LSLGSTAGVNSRFAMRSHTAWARTFSPAEKRSDRRVFGKLEEINQMATIKFATSGDAALSNMHEDTLRNLLATT
jgi:hypothetical protein